MKKIIMMAVAAFMATAANAQFEKGTWSLQPFLGGSISSITNVGSFDIDDGIELKKRTRVGYIIGGEAEYQSDGKTLIILMEVPKSRLKTRVTFWATSRFLLWQTTIFSKVLLLRQVFSSVSWFPLNSLRMEKPIMTYLEMALREQ